MQGSAWMPAPSMLGEGEKGLKNHFDNHLFLEHIIDVMKLHHFGDNLFSDKLCTEAMKL